MPDYRAFFGAPNWSDVATWAEGTGTPNVNPAFPIGKILTDQPQDRFQSADVATTVKLQGTLTAALTFNFISVLFSNAASTCTWKIRASNVSMGGVDVLDYTGTHTFWPTGTPADYDRVHAIWSSDTQLVAKYIEIEIDDVSPANPEGFWTCGRVFIGDLWRVPLAYGSGLFGFADEGASQTHRSAVTSIIKGNPSPKLPFTLLCDSRDEMYQRGHAIARMRGGTKSVVLYRDPGYDDYKMQSLHYGVIEGDIIPIEGSFEYYSLRLALRGLT
jgi:hypothetical protein